MIWSLNNQNRTDDIKGQMLCMMMILMRMTMRMRRMVKVPCEKGRTSKLYIGAKLLLAVGAGSW